VNNSQHRTPHLLVSILVQFLMAAGLTACTSIDRQVFSDAYVDKPVASERVRILRDPTAVASCRKVALLKAKGEQPEEKMLSKLRKSAGKLGANSLLVVESRRSTIQDVIEGLPEAAAAGALGIDATPPPAQTVEAIAYYCDESN
jgi:hypothetical protein